jgi:hypothetical protein
MPAWYNNGTLHKQRPVVAIYVTRSIPSSPPRSPRSLYRPAAINGDAGASDKTRRVAGQEDGQSANLL